jgi:hypothetical protein
VILVDVLENHAHLVGLENFPDLVESRIVLERRDVDPDTDLDRRVHAVLNRRIRE